MLADCTLGEQISGARVEPMKDQYQINMRASVSMQKFPSIVRAWLLDILNTGSVYVCKHL